MRYNDKLKHPLWQKKRLQIMERDGFKCLNCGDDETELQIHHLKYEYGLAPWKSNNSDLVCLCKNCHSVLGQNKSISLDDIINCNKVSLISSEGVYKLTFYEYSTLIAMINTSGNDIIYYGIFNKKEDPEHKSKMNIISKMFLNLSE
ncbi:MAG: hypothetical protein WC389_17505 [Lutibacter sp.]|jgi:hypothetical protein